MTEEIWLPQINRSVCTGCGDCIQACPTEALGLEEAKAILSMPDACSYCGSCEMICPVFAIELPYQIILAVTP